MWFKTSKDHKENKNIFRPKNGSRITLVLIKVITIIIINY